MFLNNAFGTSPPKLLKLTTQDHGSRVRIVLTSNHPFIFQKKTNDHTLCLTLHSQGWRLAIPRAHSLASKYLQKYHIRDQGKCLKIFFQGHHPLSVISATTSRLAGRKTYQLTLEVREQKKTQTLAHTQKHPVIVIDPGHGGHDPGAQGVSGTYEKHITLSTARILQKVLMEDQRYDVYLTRTDDRFISLKKRVAYAHQKKAKLFISLHADSHPHPNTRGLSLYILSDQPSDQATQALAMKENLADTIKGIPEGIEDAQVARILQDLTQRETLLLSRRIAMLLTTNLASSFVMLKSQYGAGAFKVLQSPEVPSILIEMGCLSHPQEEKALLSLKRQKHFARVLKKTIDAYFKKK